MATDRLMKYTYKCSCCGKTIQEYIWNSELEIKELICDNCQCVVDYNDLVTEISNQTFTILTKMDKSQIKADRARRSQDHFKKEILPTLGKRDRKHFENKHKA